uniref:Uncharacterized protein n=1 Tax=Chlorocebus sabaeus TaxID=60711 RepID=A0A0D9SC53_CHLSB
FLLKRLIHCLKKRKIKRKNKQLRITTYNYTLGYRAMLSKTTKLIRNLSED